MQGCVMVTWSLFPTDRKVISLDKLTLIGSIKEFEGNKAGLPQHVAMCRVQGGIPQSIIDDALARCTDDRFRLAPNRSSQFQGQVLSLRSSAIKVTKTDVEEFLYDVNHSLGAILEARTLVGTDNSDKRRSRSTKPKTFRRPAQLRKN